jgi:hypothetical protein
MDYPIEILMIDDDIDNYESLKNFAAKNRVILRYSNNLKDGVARLRESKKIMAVILDGKGFIEPNQERGSEREDFVHEALTMLALLESEQKRFIPKCVLTAWYDKLLESLESRVKVYDKKKIVLDEEVKTELFAHLKKQAFESDLYRIRKNYLNIFTAIGRLNFHSTIDTNLFFALSKIESQSINKSDFNNLRDLFEAILTKINSISSITLPNNLFKADGRPNLEFCIRYLSGLQIKANDVLLYDKIENPRVDAHIASAFVYVKNGTSILSHNYKSKWSNYFYSSIVFALCEIFIWLEQFHLDGNKQIIN